MSRRVPKSVSVSPVVDQLITEHFSRRGQFSAFVRAAVLDHDERVNTGGGPHTPIEGLGICNGVRRPTCSICFPEGPPLLENWQDFRRKTNEYLKLPDRDGKIEIHFAVKELLDSIEPRPARPRIDDTGTFPVKLTRWGRFRRWIGLTSGA